MRRLDRLEPFDNASKLHLYNFNRLGFGLRRVQNPLCLFIAFDILTRCWHQPNAVMMTVKGIRTGFGDGRMQISLVEVDLPSPQREYLVINR